MLKDSERHDGKFARSQSRIKKFGTFAGLFTPDMLTILGVIMYLRLDWVVGNAGFLGAVIIILPAKSVKIVTGLSMSSITTNIRIGAGRAYSIISKSLGLEVGGSTGIPLYIAQTLSTALYHWFYRKPDSSFSFTSVPVMGETFSFAPGSMLSAPFSSLFARKTLNRAMPANRPHLPACLCVIRDGKMHWCENKKS